MVHTNFTNGISDIRWLVLYVGSRKEKAVLKSLESNQIEAYVPLKERLYKYASKSLVRQLPIIPGYVFVRAGKKDLGPILGIPFVFGFLKTGDSYSVVSEGEISHLRRLCSADQLSWCEEPVDTLRAGALVEIVRGPLAGVRGRFVDKKGKDLFVVSFGDQLQTQLGTFEIRRKDITLLEEVFMDK
ncbi:transcription termination/antitermination NusG family protein [Neolewinella agarilytica]|uniref:Transcription antitermination factor NusG n=1 Tax=Neolewinella agarilytica TaxID=478744 RepID=A0A1H9GM17_9BACT|nr:transcription termination/antitermination NusG family protein [Neolewinella agarilytica]SEQ51141.1 Transcription antitermination factor NusG [Neolewinella agarilytica]